MYAAAKGWQSTAPKEAVRLLERYRFVKSHPAYTYKDYDEMPASDIWLDGELAKVEQALIETAREKAEHG